MIPPADWKRAEQLEQGDEIRRGALTGRVAEIIFHGTSVGDGKTPYLTLKVHAYSSLGELNEKHTETVGPVRARERIAPRGESY